MEHSLFLKERQRNSLVIAIISFKKRHSRSFEIVDKILVCIIVPR